MSLVILHPEKITNYLNRLNFSLYIMKLNKVWEVKIPTLRSDDITREIDLIEEIGQITWI
jgi:phenylalanyl-tRNA synthetase beta subunit